MARVTSKTSRSATGTHRISIKRQTDLTVSSIAQGNTVNSRCLVLQTALPMTSISSSHPRPRKRKEKWDAIRLTSRSLCASKHQSESRVHMLSFDGCMPIMSTRSYRFHRPLSKVVDTKLRKRMPNVDPSFFKGQATSKNRISGSG